MADQRSTEVVRICDPTTNSQQAAVDSSGRLSVSINASTATVTVDTELPAAVALSDTLANPTAPAVGAYNLGWDGTQWKRIWGIKDGDAVSASAVGFLIVGTDGSNYQVFATDTSGRQFVVGPLTHNNAAPIANNVGVLPAVASTSPPTYNEGDQVLLSTTLGGALRTSGADTQQLNGVETQAVNDDTNRRLLEQILVEISELKDRMFE